MSNFFFGLTLNTQALTAEQNYIALPGKPSPEPQQLGASAASGFDPGVDPVALNPQPLPPEEGGINAALLASLPVSFLDTVALNPQPLPPAEIADTLSLVALNPQPLPPQESPSTMNLPVSLPSGLRLPSPAELLYKANVIGTVSDGQQGGPELQRHELWGDMARPADQVSLGGSVRERHTLQNLIDDSVHSANPWGRDRVMPWNPSDYIGGVGSYPILGDRMRAPLFVQGAGDVDEVAMNDIKQRAIGDCYFLGSLAALARHDPQRIKDMVVDHGDGTYTVTFKEAVPYTAPPQYKDWPITVTGDFPGGVSGYQHAGPGDLTDQGTLEIWPLVFEKAYGVYIDKLDPYGTLDRGGKSRIAMEAITGQPIKVRGDMEDDLNAMGISNPMYLGPTMETFDEMLADFQAGRAITVSTDDNTRNLVPAHCYAVSKVYRDADGNGWVELYNPWGKKHPEPMRFEDLQSLRICTA